MQNRYDFHLRNISKKTIKLGVFFYANPEFDCIVLTNSAVTFLPLMSIYIKSKLILKTHTYFSVPMNIHSS